jgi:peroxiredoxin
MPINLGDAAPDFTLFNTEKQAVNLSSYHGKNIVILFFPLAFTSTCTAELCGVRDDISNYSKMDAEILAISVDSPFALGKFKEELGLNFNLLSDFNKTVSEAYGLLYDSFVLDMKGVSKRSAFVLDREGVVRYAEVLEKASDVPNLDAVKEILKTL